MLHMQMKSTFTTVISQEEKFEKKPVHQRMHTKPPADREALSINFEQYMCHEARAQNGIGVKSPINLAADTGN